VNWEEVEVLTDLVRFHHQRMLDRNPWSVGQVDQDIMHFRELVEQTGVPLEEITARDFFMLMHGLLLTQKVSYFLKERGQLTSLEMVRVLTTSSTAAFAVIAAINPILLEEKSLIDEDGDDDASF
jgi:hypothetical protein